MRRSQRLIASAVLISLCGALAGCSSSLSNWDPSDMLDFLDTKKKLPGKREAVFPEGVPGVEQGVPKELYKSNVEQQQQQAAAPAVVAPAPDEPKRTRRSRAKGKPAAVAATPAGEETVPAEEGSTAAAPPAPKPKRLVHRRATSLPKDQPAPQDQAPPPQPPAPQQTQPAASPFPAPMPSGSFSR